MAKNNYREMLSVDEEKVKDWINEQIKGAVKELFEQIMEAEVEELICAGPYERGEERKDHRNGKRKRSIKTRVGEIELDVPRLRTLGFQTRVIDRYRRMEISLEEALIEMYLEGISTRKVTDITEALCGTTVSASGQSRLNKKVYKKLESWRKRELAPVWPYVWLDGVVMKAKVAERYQNISLLVAVGVNTEGFREVIGIAPGGQEDRGSWLSFLRWLKDRGLEYIGLAVSDAHFGLGEALSECFPQADWQRCTVHHYRNVLTMVPRRMREEVVSSLKAIHNQESAEEARSKAQRVISRYRKGLPDAMRILEDGLEGTLTYYSYPKRHWRYIRTNNPLERLFREVKRRTKVVGVFPDVTSCLMLATARLRWTEEKCWNKRRYVDIDLLLEDLVQRHEEAKTSKQRTR